MSLFKSLCDVVGNTNDLGQVFVTTSRSLTSMLKGQVGHKKPKFHSITIFNIKIKFNFLYIFLFQTYCIICFA